MQTSAALSKMSMIRQSIYNDPNIIVDDYVISSISEKLKLVDVEFLMEILLTLKVISFLNCLFNSGSILTTTNVCQSVSLSSYLKQSYHYTIISFNQ